MKTVDELMREAFGAARDQRSPEYQAGVRAELDYRLHKKPAIAPYELGTAACDAFYAGRDEGREIYRHYAVEAASTAAQWLEHRGEVETA